MENRLRRCNLRFIGLPEGVEGAEHPTFLEKLLCDTYGKEAFFHTFVVERAHHMSCRLPPVGPAPRMFIAKFLIYRDRYTILHLSREKGNIPFGNKMIAVFPDFFCRNLAKRRLYQAHKVCIALPGMPEGGRRH